MNRLHDDYASFSFFYEVSDRLKAHSAHYFPRFNYAACELWLCNEICHLVNAGENGLQQMSDGDVFLYNEDNKRDLTLYTAGRNIKAEIQKHIEVKVAYPHSKSDFMGEIKSLCKKLSKSLDKQYRLEGWVYLVWTQYYAISPDAFFETRLHWLKTELTSGEYRGASGITYQPMFSTVKEIAEGNLTWRGQDKHIVVKAVAFSFHKEWK
ncbi:hypothetical protein [Chimaeribacter arupi]|uniref:hypothetical protein n=1 Tax=Chimaeribacter arupi TaxID=2060066 RepID=UPI002947685E|nr:hypothetical protein [Chimaeribacter arupi]MDV5140222.1 hypothetical protein [Chimaeribacter arupi]